MSSVDLVQAVAALRAEYAAIDGVVEAMDDEQLLEPSGCRGWSRADLLFHMLLDAQRALVTLHSPVPGPPDEDFVSYWRGFSSSDEGAVAHARFVRVVAAAHASPKGLAGRWLEASAAARHAASAAVPGFVTTQGHVLATADFVATLVVEATIHHLDLVDDPPPPAPALAVTTSTLDGLLGASRPAAWDDVTYLKKATGRDPLTEEDRAALGATADVLPVFS